MRLTPAATPVVLFRTSSSLSMGAPMYTSIGPVTPVAISPRPVSDHAAHTQTTAVEYIRIGRVVWENNYFLFITLSFDVPQTALYNKQWTSVTEIPFRRRLRLNPPLSGSTDATLDLCNPSSNSYSIHPRCT
jgi:hypothetical protein